MCTCKKNQKLKDIANQENRNELLLEAKHLSSCNHDNIIKVYGVCYRRKCLSLIVMEYMNMGDLLSYLKNKPKNQNNV
jgi:serine/threonine protein kinase